MTSGGSPRRIQRKRIKGWRMPPNTVSVCRPGKWGNPTATADGYRFWLAGLNPCWTARETLDQTESRRLWILEHVHELRGKNVACWCRLDEACHGDVLLELANAESEARR